MRVFKSIAEWMSFRETLPQGTLGLVPTMGALHDGHGSLVKRSVSENSQSLVSIFVNPTQFNDPKDLEKYPRTFDADVELLTQAGADYLLYPTFEEIYPDHYRYKISENEFSLTLCGKHRPGHFDGVLTIVMKLLQIARAQNAYFGEKDFQQLELIHGMAQAFFLETKITGLPTVRERDGLAMSSRNVRLTSEERERAPFFFRCLSQKNLSCAEISSELTKSGFQVEYIEETPGRRLGAVHLGKVRLIDNVPL